LTSTSHTAGQWDNDLKVSAAIYPTRLDKVDEATYAHEAVHFLAGYGFPKDRLIKTDVPLPNVIGDFFRLVDDPQYRTNHIGWGALSKSIPRRILNPFHFDYKEHSPEEVIDAGVLSWTLFQIHQKHGEDSSSRVLNFLVDNLDRDVVNFREGTVW